MWNPPVEFLPHHYQIINITYGMNLKEWVVETHGNEWFSIVGLSSGA